MSEPNAKMAEESKGTEQWWGLRGFEFATLDLHPDGGFHSQTFGAGRGSIKERLARLFDPLARYLPGQHRPGETA